MNEPNAFFALINIVCGALFISISIPLLKRKIRMNRWYGFRISKAFRSNENWFAINEYGAKRLIVWSLPIIAVGIICLFVPLDEERQSVSNMVVGIGPITVFPLIAIIQTLMYARKL